MREWKAYYQQHREQIKRTRQNRVVKKRVENYLNLYEKLPDRVRAVLVRSKIIFSNRGRADVIDVSDLKMVDYIITIYGECTPEKIFYATAKIYVKKLNGYSKINEDKLVRDRVEIWKKEFRSQHL